jgi:hypothetical protein
MSLDTFNEVVESILTGVYTRYGSQPELIRLFSGDRGTAFNNYIEIEQEKGGDDIIQLVSGGVLYNDLKGTITIVAESEARRENMYLDAIDLFTAAAYNVRYLGKKEFEEQGNYKTELRLSVWA